METLLDLSTLSNKEVTDRLKAVDDSDKVLPTNSVTNDGNFSSLRSSGSLVRRRRSRMACLHPRTIIDNCVGRTSLAAAGAMTGPAVETQGDP
jgi:hypothetical protein